MRHCARLVDYVHDLDTSHARNTVPLGDVISLVALDLELRVIFTGMARIAFVLRIARVDLDYPTGNIASLGIPENVIADFKVFAHDGPQAID
jgi:hypothetical protein